ncbi:MAG: RluA family pseudouridine synthase [Brockia lithotrophica]|nr:RluA family pseudouridine synthase [Brockia lithotrophica]
MNRGGWADVPGVSLRVVTWEAGKDVRAFLRGRGFSRRLVRQLAEAGSVRVDGLPWTPGGRPFLLSAGQRVDVAFPPPPERHVEPVSGPLAVAYEDEDILVVDKPPGLLVHPLPWERGGSLLGRVYAYLLSTRGPSWYPHLVHRLDRPTSGLVLVALHPWAKHALSRALAAGRVRRGYAALLTGDLPADAGTIEGGIRRRADSLLLREVHPQGRAAQTSFKVVRRCGRATWVRAILGSGRTHQIRVHFSSLGYPVVGDGLYGGREEVGENRTAPDEFGDEASKAEPPVLRRIALHAEVLRFPDLRGRGERAVVSPVPGDLRAIWEEICGRGPAAGEGGA